MELRHLTNFDKWLLALIIANVTLVLYTPFFYSLLNRLSSVFATPAGYPTMVGLLVSFLLVILIIRLILQWVVSYNL